MTTSAASAPLLEAVGLGKRYRVGGVFASGARGEIRAVDDVSFEVWPGETLGIVGESGCGKSTLARCLVRLHEVSAGVLRFEGRDITRLGPRAMRPIRARLQMVFQDSLASLNPRRRVGDLIAEPLRVQGRRSDGEVRQRLRELASLVGLLPDQLERYPHAFSGGQLQRVGIARALALAPRLVVADEPVSALDVSIRAQIVNLFADLQERLGLTYVFIAHDLSVVRQVSTRTAVMYLGAIVEVAPTEALYAAPAHPYTRALLDSVPEPRVAAGARRVHVGLAGEPPSPLDPPAGCRFHPRCPLATERCRTVRPPLLPSGAGRSVACHHPLSAPAAGPGPAVGQVGPL